MGHDSTAPSSSTAAPRRGGQNTEPKRARPLWPGLSASRPATPAVIVTLFARPIGNFASIAKRRPLLASVSSDGITSELGRATKAVQNRRSNLQDKLRLGTAAALVRWALDRRLAPDGSTAA